MIRLETNRIKTLDSLRGLAVFSVVLFHYNTFNYGYLGVHLFFIMSGFVIFMSVQKVNKPLDFLRNRFCRLYPAYWFCVTLTAIWILSFSNKLISLNMYLMNLTMFQQFFRVEHIDGAYWSLEIELLFYFGVAILLTTNKIWKYIEYLLVIVILSVLLTFIQDNPHITFLNLMLRYTGLFYAGIIFYKIWINGFNYKDSIKIVIAYLCVICFDFGNQSGFYYKPVEVFYLTLIFLLFILFALKKLQFIEIKPLLFLGKISYSLYLLHEVIGLIILKYLDGVFSSKIFSTVCTIFIVILFSWFTNKYIEVPGSKFFKMYFSRINRSKI